MKRVFVGIPLDSQTHKRVDDLLEPMVASQQGVRWVPVNNRHLTLAFLGTVPIAVLEQILLLSDKYYLQESAFQYQFTALTRFPNRAGRIIALTGQADRSLNQLHQSTLQLLDICMGPIEGNDFRPHITVGRIKRPGQSKLELNLSVNINTNVTKVVIYKSRLTRKGSIYSRLKEIQLN